MDTVAVDALLASWIVKGGNVHRVHVATGGAGHGDVYWRQTAVDQQRL